MAAGHKTGGRQKGTPNKNTVSVREAIAVFAEDNVGKLQEWLDKIGGDDPVKAADLYVRLLEYHVPKLARSEHTGKDGAELFPTDVNVNAVPAKKDNA